MKPLPGRTLFLLAVIAAVLWVGYMSRAVVTPLVASLLLAYVLDPVVRRLERLGLGRSTASAVVVIVAFFGILGGGAMAATRVVREAGSFYSDVVGEAAVQVTAPDVGRAEAERRLSDGAPDPDAVRQRLRSAEWDGRTWLFDDEDGDGAFRPGIARAGVQRISSDLAKHPATDGLARRLAASEDAGTLVASSAGKWLGAAADTSRSAAGTVLGLLTLLVLFPIYLYYSLSQLAHVYEVAVTHLPAAHRQRVVEILGKIHATLSSFFRGRLILLVLRFVVQLPLFLAFGVPFSAVCASFSAIASLVPVLGGIAAAAVPLLLLLSVGASSGTVIGFVAALVTWELIEQYALTPAIVGRRVGLHPLTILVGTFVAGDLLGVFGMLVAIPLVAVLKILAIEFVVPEVRRQAGIAPEGAEGKVAPGGRET